MKPTAHIIQAEASAEGKRRCAGGAMLELLHSIGSDHDTLTRRMLTITIERAAEVAAKDGTGLAQALAQTIAWQTPINVAPSWRRLNLGDKQAVAARAWATVRTMSRAWLAQNEALRA